MRILYENLIDVVDASKITPLTVDENYPVSNIQDQRLSVKYKSDTSTTQSIVIELPTYPMIPDNVAGRTYYKDKDWAVTTGWSGGAGTVLSIENSTLKIAVPDGNAANIYYTSPSFQNKLVRVIIKTDKPVTNIYTVTGSTAYTPMNNLIALGGNRYSADIYWSRTGLDIFNIWPNYGATTAIIWYLETIYIGSGLYDTPVYNKACCNRFTNNGVLPVKGNRGLALSFNGAQSLVADNPVIGTSGTIAFWIKRRTIGTTQLIAYNRNIPVSGITLYIDEVNILKFNLYNGIAYNYGTQVITDATLWHPVVITYNASALIFNIDGVDVETIANPQVPALATAVLTIGASFNGEMSLITYDSSIWTLAQKQRFANGTLPIDNSTLMYIDLDSQYKVNTLAILGHNLKIPNIKVQANDTNDFTSPALTEYLSYNKGTILKFLSSSYIYKYWKFSFMNQASIEIGRLWLGQYITIDPSSLLNFKVSKQRDDIVTYGRGRQKFSDIGNGWRAFNFSFPKTSYTMIKKIEDLFDFVGLHSSFIFCNFDTIRDYEIVEPCYCSFNKELTFNHTKNMKFEYSVDFEEDL